MYSKYIPLLSLSLSLPPLFVLSLPPKVALARPVLYSNWLTKDYLPVNQEELRDYVQARLKVFYEEELDVPLVLFDEVLDHVLRIDRIFKQSQVYNSYGLRYLTHTCTHTHTRTQGHLLLIGVSGAGKTTLSRFVAWINGLSVFQVKVSQQHIHTLCTFIKKLVLKYTMYIFTTVSGLFTNYGMFVFASQIAHNLTLQTCL